MLKKLLIALPLVFVIGCSGEEEEASGDGGPPVTQDQIDSGEAPSAAGMAGAGGTPEEQGDSGH